MFFIDQIASQAIRNYLTLKKIKIFTTGFNYNKIGYHLRWCIVHPRDAKPLLRVLSSTVRYWTEFVGNGYPRFYSDTDGKNQFIFNSEDNRVKYNRGNKKKRIHQLVLSEVSQTMC